MKLYIAFSLLVLLLIPGQAVTNFSSDTQDSKTNIQSPKDILSQNVDILLVGEVYLSDSDIVDGESIDIYGLVRNDGDIRVSSYVIFTVGKYDIASRNVDLDPKEEQYVKASWTAIAGENVISINVEVIDQDDVNPENNFKSTTVNVSAGSQTEFDTNTIESGLETNIPESPVISNLPETENELDIEISETIETTHEIRPGDTQSINLKILSNTISDEYQVIVGGITDQISVDPSLWSVSLVQGQEIDFQVDVSASVDVDIGSFHNIELLLYRSSNPSEIIQKSFSIYFISEYTENPAANNNEQNSTSESDFSYFVQGYQNQLTMDFMGPSPLISTNELNIPSIENITINPSYPNIQQNVTVNADIIDDSILINATLFYSLDDGFSWLNASMVPGVQNNWSANITTPGSEVNVTYYIQAYDNFTNVATSQQYYFMFDATLPVFSEITNPGTVSTQDPTSITVHLVDSVGIDNLEVFLYYSYDNSTYFMIQMTQLNGSAFDGYYDVIIPATTNSLVYYYINATDLSGLTNSSLLTTYATDAPPTSTLR